MHKHGNSPLSTKREEVSVCYLATGQQNGQREMDDTGRLNLISIGSQIEHRNRGYIFDRSNKQHIVHCFFGIHRFIYFVVKLQ
jgi:hypothetical protein